jgi:hypothetical protein
MSEKPNGIQADIGAESAQAPQPLNLSLYNNARTALAALHRIDEVKDIADKAVAMQAYARRAKDPEFLQIATELRLRAGRRVGELLQEMAKRGERDPGGRGRVELRPATQLADLGVTKSQSSRWQKLANLPEPAFEAHVAETRKRLEHSVDRMSAPATAKTPRRKKPAPATPDEPAEVSALQVEIRQLRGALSRAQQELVLRSPARLVATLEHIYTKAQDRTTWPIDENWQQVKVFVDRLESALSAARALKL